AHRRLQYDRAALAVRAASSRELSPPKPGFQPGGQGNPPPPLDSPAYLFPSKAFRTASTSPPLITFNPTSVVGTPLRPSSLIASAPLRLLVTSTLQYPIPASPRRLS
ncbi:MAG: hypothetical protein ABFD96_06215, partial [Armatimonadia bacterium]